MRPGNNSDQADPVDAADFPTRFWLPRGREPDLDWGFPADPESPSSRFVVPSALPVDALVEFPVLGLLGEPGMGKSTAVDQETRRLEAAQPERGFQVLNVDLAACGSDFFVLKNIFESEKFRSWKESQASLDLFLDGFDTCLQIVLPLVSLLPGRFKQESRDRLRLRIACRTGEWPPDLEDGLRERRDDVVRYSEAGGVRGEDFLKEVDRLGASQFANWPITLRFLLDSFRAGKGLPSRKADLYRDGCLVLCDEWRNDLRRLRHPHTISSGLRFALAGRLAAVTVFSRRTAICRAPRGLTMLEGDVRSDDLFGREERFDREIVKDIGEPEIRDTVETALFRSVGPHRFAFSHQTYAEFLAARYLVDRGLPTDAILRLLLHADGSGKVVPQLRETAAWLAAMVPDVGKAILSSDPATLLMSDTPPESDGDRRKLVCQILRLYDSGELAELRIGRQPLWKHGGARFKYAGIADDLRPYIVDKSRRLASRHVAVMAAQLTGSAELQTVLLHAALDDKEDYGIRVVSGVTIRMIGDENSKAALKALIAVDPQFDPDDQLKGIGLAAAWPQHLAAAELFAALTPSGNTRIAGEYARFLWSGFEAKISRIDMILALRWARGQALNSHVKDTPLGRAALRVIAAAIDCYEDVGVRDEVADIVVHLAELRVSAVGLRTKFSSHHDARRAIAHVAFQSTTDYCL
jgi:hypothetical protein